MKRLLRSLFSLLLWVLAIAMMVASFRNVFWDDTQSMAAQAACGGRPGCSAQMTEGMRTPIGHSYRFLVAGRHVEITCRRAYLFDGAYTCAEKALDWVSPPSASASASVSAPTARGSAPKPRK